MTVRAHDGHDGSGLRYAWNCDMQDDEASHLPTLTRSSETEQAP